MAKGPRIWLGIGGIVMAVAVALDAWYAHGLRHRLEESAYAMFGTGLQQHYRIALGMLVVGLLRHRAPKLHLQLTGWMFLAALLGFSGTLYARSFGAPEALGQAAPIGGSLHILAWLSLGIAGLRAAPDRYSHRRS
ncbi:MAG: DUF423 domain-containing protein [Planctomycetota bacterium]|nr:MAG: DUF423 domain-containing protein [Planctomycetota bacterium]